MLLRLIATNSLIRSEVDTMKVVGLGLDNIVVVAMLDAVLDANKNDTLKEKSGFHVEIKEFTSGRNIPKR